MKKLIVVGGPTATGKTKIALEIAKKYDGELINADSRQIYKYLDIGTNKEASKLILEGDKYFLENIPLHLINIIEPNQRFSVFEYQAAAYKAIEDILKRNKLPILVGGTGLYIDAVLKSYKLTATTELDSEARELLETKTTLELQELLKKLDQNKYSTLNNSDINNPRRLARLIEKAQNNSTAYENLEPKYVSLFFYPKYNWENLKLKIEKRVEQMFKDGLVEETKNILKGYKRTDPGLKIMGYSQVIQALNGEFDFEKCIELVKLAHKQYARRQRTWFEGEGRGYKLQYISNILEAQEYIEYFLQ